jgi:hypothetical protein
MSKIPVIECGCDSLGSSFSLEKQNHHNHKKLHGDKTNNMRKRFHPRNEELNSFSYFSSTPLSVPLVSSTAPYVLVIGVFSSSAIVGKGVGVFRV